MGDGSGLQAGYRGNVEVFQPFDPGEAGLGEAVGFPVVAFSGQDLGEERQVGQLLAGGDRGRLIGSGAHGWQTQAATRRGATARYAVAPPLRSISRDIVEWCRPSSCPIYRADLCRLSSQEIVSRSSIFNSSCEAIYGPVCQHYQDHPIGVPLRPFELAQS